MYKTLPMLLALFGLFYSIFSVMEVRAHIRQFTAEKSNLNFQLRRLEDERRSLRLEIATFTEYARVEKAASDLGMVVPSLEEGSLFYLHEIR